MRRRRVSKDKSPRSVKNGKDLVYISVMDEEAK